MPAIPQIIHQTWKDSILPVEMATFQQTWKTHHPNWQYQLWTDADNRRFLQNHYPWFLPIYDSYSQNICRVDAVRYFILMHYGGVFIDLDFECLRPLDDLLADRELVFGQEPDAHVALEAPQALGLHYIVCPSLIASRPGHPFWQAVWQALIGSHRCRDPLDATGPFLLTRTYKDYADKDAITLVPAALLYPATKFDCWQGRVEDSAFRQAIAPTAFAIHHWQGTWWMKSPEKSLQAQLQALWSGAPIRQAIAQITDTVQHWSETMWKSWLDPQGMTEVQVDIESETESIDVVPVALLLQGRIVLHTRFDYARYKSLVNPDQLNSGQANPSDANPANANSGQANLVEHTNLPLISGMMVTKHRVAQAKLAIACFQHQTYPHKELIIIDDDEQDDLAQYVAQLADCRIRHFRLEPQNQTLGDLRNIALSHTTGSYVCQWDDDDLAHPLRLELQMATLLAQGAEACFLQRWLMWWVEQRRLAVSRSRVWEGSMLCRKATLYAQASAQASAQATPYPADRQGEDTAIVQQIMQHCRVVLLDHPQLYLYIIHQHNTFDEVHFDLHWQMASLRYEGIDYDKAVAKLSDNFPLSPYQTIFSTSTYSPSTQPSPPSPTLRSCHPAPFTHAPLGLNVNGLLTSETGLGEAARGMLRSMAAVNIPFVLNNLPQDGQYADTSYTDFIAENPYPINLVHVNPNLLADPKTKQVIHHWIKRDYFECRYNIGCWVWDNPTIPAEWQAAFKLFNEIWTPTTFSADIISAAAPIPVIKIPHCVTLPSNTMTREALGLPQNKFIFLFIFDYYSDYERKNPEAVVKAFKQAFPRPDQDVLLLLKTHRLPDRKIARLKALADHSPAVQIINQILSREQINGLLSNCDCYVSLHRAEGFGLTMAEAMLCGKPVIATAYSGNTDFTQYNNSFLVDYQLTTLAQKSLSYPKGTQWAEPDVDHAAHLMRQVFAHRDEAKQVGERAAQYIQTGFSPEAIGKLIRQRLDYLSQTDRLSPKNFLQAQPVRHPWLSPPILGRLLQSRLAALR